jgi:hypothetical protein
MPSSGWRALGTAAATASRSLGRPVREERERLPPSPPDAQTKGWIGEGSEGDSRTWPVFCRILVSYRSRKCDLQALRVRISPPGNGGQQTSDSRAAFRAQPDNAVC